MKALFLLAFALIFAGNCNNVSGSKNDNTNTRNLVVLGAIASANSGSAVNSIQFKAVTKNGSEVKCGTKLTGVNSISGSEAFYLRDLRFFVSSIQLTKDDGTKVDFSLKKDDVWQTEKVALIDLEDQTGDCSVGTPEMNVKLLGSAPAGNYKEISFDLGVPAEINHLDTTTQPAPMNVNAMYWNWRGGYKFLKLEFLSKDGSGSTSSVHLGSMSCDGGSMTSPSQNCAIPNRPRITVKKSDNSVIDFSKDLILFDLEGILAETNTNVTKGGVGLNCMAGNSIASCQKVINNLGLNYSNGQTQAELLKTFRMD